MEELPMCASSEFCLLGDQTVLLDQSSIPNITGYPQMPSQHGIEKQHQVLSDGHGEKSVMNNAESCLSSSISEQSVLSNPASTSNNSIVSQKTIPSRPGCQMPQQLSSDHGELPQNQGPSMDLTNRKEPWLKVITLEPHQLLVSQKSNSILNKYHNPPPSRLGFSNVSLHKMSLKGKRVAEHVAPPPQKVTNEPFESIRSKMRESLASAFDLVCNKQTETKAVESHMGNPNPDPNGKLSIDVHGSQLSVDTGSKDDLLVENGLSWSSHFTDAERIKLQDDVTNEVGSQNTPQVLAIQIESELFKLFGGVNKKYKEKGRSLLFNLRDQHNPELRKRVFSGEIAPERLCSMTAAELASKELSDWRIAKAEEFAQMVVLPDSEVDLKCLVKKTHKGEIQVGVERDDSVSFDEHSICPGFQSHSLPESNKNRPPRPARLSGKIEQIRSKYKGTESSAAAGLTVPSKDNIPENNNEEDNTLSPILHDDTDLMQDLILDEFRDAESLPPVPSLDEFMQELDLQPPFENLPIDVVQSSTENKLVDTNTIKSESRPESPIAEMDTKSKHAAGDSDLNPNMTGSWSPIIIPMAPVANFSYLDTQIPSQIKPVNIIKSEPVWDGLIQLNTSSLVTALGFYRSGERISVNTWPGFLEIKGQVRLDAFEKFLQELNLSQSRSRVVMVLQFVWKKGTSESGHIKLSQTIDSYTKDDLVGFAEPIISGVELYFCSPHPKPCHMLMTNLPIEHRASLAGITTGLIGIVFWRKSITTTTSSVFPKTPHTNPNPNHINKERPVFPNGTESDDDGDVPPGFGIDNNRPKFDLVQSGTTTTNTKVVSNSVPPCVEPSSLDRLRQLVQMYGKSETKTKNEMGMRNDDDGCGDDMPEQPYHHYHHHRVLKRQRTQPPMPPHHYDPMPPHLSGRGFKRGGNRRGRGRGPTRQR